MEAVMQKLQNAFASIGVVEILEILLIAVTLFLMIKIMIGNNAVRLLWIYVIFTLALGVLLFFTGYKYADLIMIITQALFFVVTVALFATEIKRSIWNGRLGDSKYGEHHDDFNAENAIEEIVKAVQNMSKNDVGALIILSNGNLPSGVLESGVLLDADISSQLIESVFFPKTALHDGAMILKGTKIQAAGCFLPLAQEYNLSKDLGSRHRAGIGLTETVNVTAIIVSEETGIISIAKGGKIIRYIDIESLRGALKQFYWQELVA